MNRYKVVRLAVLVVILMYISAGKATAQFSVMLGANKSTVLSKIKLENKESISDIHCGLSFQYYPFKNTDDISVINEIQISRRGYRQDLQKKYDFRFTYFAFPVLLNYSLSERFAVQGGIELSSLIFTNIKQGRDTYNHFDAGLVLGLSCFNNNTISLYTRVIYGMIPMLDYHRIDDLGNFNGKIHDLHNLSLSVGIKINLYNEKIRF